MPGLFDSSLDLDYLHKEVVRSIDLARDGIHAVLVVFSTRTRFSDEEKFVISSLVSLFGSKIYDYMIIVFTGGDELEEDEIRLEKFLSDCPESLKKDNLELLQDVQGLKENCNLTEDEMLVTIEQMREKQLKRIVEMFESMFIEMKLKLEQALEEARAACERAKEKAKGDRKDYEDKTKNMEEELERVQQVADVMSCDSVVTSLNKTVQLQVQKKR
ncbi:hypothetical protein L1987_30604 [Smallanthus sonchifolius]|uniref:Uncharacterized protein n=1 Tax=Smallanthus sonchifolius TaxID=185202 RepID=A0ACB9I3W9_9ASTR|nr:hypothetical protein L1987_30604 [Smallanthus sonchifolius]